jgi:LPXTG-motif cell wall-anchored protein
VAGASSSGPSSSSGGGELPFTGANALALLVAGVALLGLGVAILLRRSHSSQA